MNSDILRTHAEAFCKSRKGEWKFVGKIDSGNSACVYKLASKSQETALKIYHPRFFEGEQAKVEKRRLLDQMSLRCHGHPNLIEFYDAGEINETCFLLMEFLPWKSLGQRIKSIDRSHLPGIISKIAAAAEYLETRDFAHRDIKPANIMISDDCQGVKLLDLGVIRQISADDRSDGTDHGYALPFVATAQYSSPAYLFRTGHPTPDMWKALTFYQLGAVLHDLLMGYPLFDREVRTQNRYRVAAAVLLSTPEIKKTGVPPWLISLTRNCLVKDDDLRLRRVYWNSFHRGRPLNYKDLRRKLGLKPSKDDSYMDTKAHRREGIRVRLEKGQEFLIELCRHVFRKEGFPNIGMTRNTNTDPNSREIVFSFVPENARQSSTQLHFVLRYSFQEEPLEETALFLSYFLTKNDGIIPAEFDEDLVWTTAFDNLEEENDELLSLLTDEFINRYAVADDQLLLFEESDDSVLCLKGDGS